MHRHVNKFLNLTNQSHEKRFGFRHEHSATHALLKITEKIWQACNIGKYSCGVFSDFKKHLTQSIILFSLKKSNYGIQGLTNKWFSSFLKRRKQYRTVQGKDSDESPINYGVP